MANNFNQVGLMPGTAIRVPVNVYPGFQNGQRVITRPAHFTMQPNGVHINGAYMPGIPFPNNQINVIRRIPNQPNLLKIQKEAFFMRLLSFAEQLGDNIIHWKEVHWRELTNRFFADDTSMKYTLWAPISQKKFFEIKYQVIPRFYQTFIESGVIKIQLILGNPRPSQYNQVVCPSASIVYHYRNGIQVVAPGQLTVTFNGNLKMMEFDFQTTKYTEFLPKQQCHEFIQIPSPLNEYGIPHKTMRCLEVGEGVDYMHDVMMHTINNRNIGPIHALSIIASQSQNPNNINVAAQAVANSVTTTPNIQNSPLVKKEMKSDAQNYNSIPPTINSNDLRTAPTTPLTPKQTPQQTPTLAPSALVSNANDIGSPRQKKSSTQSPAISESTLKRQTDSATPGNKKRQRSGPKK